MTFRIKIAKIGNVKIAHLPCSKNSRVVDKGIVDGIAFLDTYLTKENLYNKYLRKDIPTQTSLLSSEIIFTSEVFVLYVNLLQAYRGA